MADDKKAKPSAQEAKPSTYEEMPSVCDMGTSPAGVAGVDYVQRDKRCAARLKVTYENFDEFRLEYTKNVSKGGMFLMTKCAYEVGERIQLNLYVPDFLEPLRIVGEVVHRQPGGEGKSPGVGIKFIEMDPASRDALVNYLSIISDCK